MYGCYDLTVNVPIHHNAFVWTCVKKKIAIVIQDEHLYKL